MRPQPPAPHSCPVHEKVASGPSSASWAGMGTVSGPWLRLPRRHESLISGGPSTVTVVSGHQPGERGRAPRRTLSSACYSRGSPELMSRDGSHRPGERQRPPSSETASSLTTFRSSGLTAGRRLLPEIPPPPRSFQGQSAQERGLSGQSRTRSPSWCRRPSWVWPTQPRKPHRQVGPPRPEP